MPAIRSILCPFDGSEFARRALRHAVALGRWYKAGITLLYVDMGQTLEASIAGGEWIPPAGPNERKRIVAWLADTAESARASGVSADVRVVEGRPTREIVKLAAELPADLVVMGTHGRSGFDRLVLGSVTEKVLRHAPCPVLTVSRRTVPTYRSGRPPFESIICPIDFSPSSLRALEYALSLAQEAYGHLTILHSLEPIPEEEDPGLRQFDQARYHAEMEKIVRRRLEGILPAGVGDWCKPENVVCRGKAYQAILEAAEHRDADVIVIGIQGRNPIDLALFGSTTQHVVRAARCPVLAIRSGPLAGSRAQESEAPADKEQDGHGSSRKETS